ncbi:MAG: hypothetical protein ABH810_01125 [bacterium]
MNSQLREQAINLRLKEELSYSEIRKKLGVPKSTLSYWLRDFCLPEGKIKELRERGWKKGEAGRERFRTAMREKRKLEDQKVYDEYRIKFSRVSKDLFFIAGLMLYSAEGKKTSYAGLYLGNTDPKIVNFFVKWMVEFLEVPKEKIKAALHLYENMDIKKEKEFWEKELGFKDDQFYKTQIRKLRKSSFSYKDSYRHGTCSLYVGGVEKRRKVMMAISAFLDGYSNMGV